MTTRFVLLLILILGTIPRKSDGQYRDWCIADEQTPDDELERAKEWACKNGGNCSMIEENQACYLPNTAKNHASYAFNSYFQRMKAFGGDCYFRSAAILTAADPSYGSCIFDVVPWSN
ncbi:unnamed protein product [Cuscuta epithymum]|uniref:X8 domain-containing protein n=1 Tax=Cuscuta epithymum TaxID=186058 RepID=A0AAV0E2S0_9ASTE|nr:unnamed protein product [Cuscuta epithymum]CAH9133794.1 unnamed protein product [Cuscuta epithymum]